MRILGRRIGFLERRTGFFDLIIFGFALYGGYCIYQNYNNPYKQVQENEIHYLVKKSTEQKQVITDNFQLGSLEYRLKGILEEGKENVRRALENTVKKYNLN